MRLNIRHQLCIISASLLALAGCQDLNSAMGNVNETLNSFDHTLQDGLKGGAGAVNTQSAQAAVDKAVPPNDAAAMFNEAKSVLVPFIATSACVNSKDYKRVWRYLDSSAGAISSDMPRSLVHYHQGGCLDVLRVTDIRRQAANAFSFKVAYIAPDSEETAFREHGAIKKSDGQWLVKWFAN